MASEGPVLPERDAAGWERLAVHDRDILASHEKIRRLIAARVGAEAAGFLGVPVFGGDGVLAGWRSPRGGALRPAGDDAGLATRADDLRGRIAALADDLEGQGDAGRMAAEGLRLALVTPEGGEVLFADGDWPVLLRWGMAVPGQFGPTSNQVRPDAASTIPIAGVAAEAMASREAVGAETAPARRRAGFAVVAWAVPVALLAVALWLGWRAAEPLPPTIVTLVPPAPEAADPTLGLSDRLAMLDAALAETRSARPRFVAVCTAPVPEECRPEALARAPGEVMLVLDASGSMAYSIDTPPERDLALMRAYEHGTVFEFNRIEAEIKEIPGERRMSVARRFLTEAVRSVPPEVAVGLVSFHDCSAGTGVRYSGSYRADRGRLLRDLARIEPTGGTALAQAIRSAARAMKGGRSAEDRVNMVVISDGLEACGGDPCAEARAAKAARPGLTINVIDLSHFSALKCVAEATGGFYRRREDGMDLADLGRTVREAAGAPPGQCAAYAGGN